jgi:type IV pilus assembly protein PilE
MYANMARNGIRKVLTGTEQGFTLIEILVVVAIVGLLAAIALPSYNDYVLRGKLVSATNGLTSMRVQMEQYYQDNRTYAATGTYTPPCSAKPTWDTFTESCDNLSATGYTLTATGSGLTAEFTYTITQDGTQATTAAPSSWGGTSTSCWVVKKNGCSS